ncbi:hypothetical protein Btru_003004 [Bulinus truncatus]|nr:hypothetical protein Btru_003004 [Bulinus truncatus]
MNQLRSWLYSLGEDRNATKNSENLNSEEKSPFDITEEKQTSIFSGSPLKKAALKYIPLAPGDCLECKLVGTSVMMLSGILVLTAALRARKSNPNIKGINGIVYTGLCGTLFIGFETAAYFRLFDKGIFSKSTSRS